uniref:Uncharacterized protein n=1 Tax=Oryza nivara TaxID=4536 RepID=A0A679BAC0_ORYNI|nr:hypothetical protein [Oryza sativa f. spontanea]BBF89883.1 hypothetical protein [Oryza sativa f. spontanea]
MHRDPSARIVVAGEKPHRCRRLSELTLCYLSLDSTLLIQAAGDASTRSCDLAEMPDVLDLQASPHWSGLTMEEVIGKPPCRSAPRIAGAAADCQYFYPFPCWRSSITHGVETSG